MYIAQCQDFTSHHDEASAHIEREFEVLGQGQQRLGRLLLVLCSITQSESPRHVAALWNMMTVHMGQPPRYRRFAITGLRHATSTRFRLTFVRPKNSIGNVVRWNRSVERLSIRPVCLDRPGTRRPLAARANFCYKVAARKRRTVAKSAANTRRLRRSFLNQPSVCARPRVQQVDVLAKRDFTRRHVVRPAKPLLGLLQAL
ncbi:hypothetical protein [Paraburkholderia piptadeniae]|uniref:hypothetical protein n=1 Tax=Paraburkholderia piptadeniae TaxID=1701573 RepID=UPI00135B4187|nr:hypothetical protein [Paraburkholderia piptadeniae]